jgi:hypothetical protein
MEFFDRILGLFSNNSSELDACINKALDIMNTIMGIDYIVTKLRDAGFTIGTIEQALPAAAKIWFDREHKKIEKSKRLNEAEKRRYLEKLEARRVSYMAKLEAVF